MWSKNAFVLKWTLSCLHSSELPSLYSVRYVWPWAEDIALSHDAYFCKKFPKSRPFPTRRKNVPNNFVGSYFNKNETHWKECPEECRPVDHKDWIYCWLFSAYLPIPSGTVDWDGVPWNHLFNVIINEELKMITLCFFLSSTLKHS